MTKGQEIALLAKPAVAYTQESRNELSAKIDAAIAEAVTKRTQECANTISHGVVLDCEWMRNRILALDKPKPPVWCAHIRRDDVGTWRYNLDSVPSAEYAACANHWLFCPVEGCGKPNPGY